MVKIFQKLIFMFAMYYTSVYFLSLLDIIMWLEKFLLLKHKLYKHLIPQTCFSIGRLDLISNSAELNIDKVNHLGD